MARRTCLYCGYDISDCHFLRRFCTPCGTYAFGRREAHQAIANAVKSGRIPPASELLCADCGIPACHYDHRDYARPLEVTAVCRSCNYKRGPAKPDLSQTPPDHAPEEAARRARLAWRHSVVPAASRAVTHEGSDQP